MEIAGGVSSNGAKIDIWPLLPTASISPFGDQNPSSPSLILNPETVFQGDLAFTSQITKPLVVVRLARYAGYVGFHARCLMLLP